MDSGHQTQFFKIIYLSIDLFLFFYPILKYKRGQLIILKFLRCLINFKVLKVGCEVRGVGGWGIHMSEITARNGFMCLSGQTG